MSIHERISLLIEIKTGGNKSKFASLIGWKPQHMTRVTKEGGSIGLAVIERILEAFPDVNARWLILGTGTPLVVEDVQHKAKLESIEKSIQEIKGMIGK